MVEGANKGRRLPLKVELSLLITALVAVVGVDPRLLVVTAVLVLPAQVAGRRRAPVAAVAGALGFVPLAATANILVVIGTIKAEHLLSLPSLGWCSAVGRHHPQAPRNIRAPLAQRADRRKPGPR